MALKDSGLDAIREGLDEEARRERTYLLSTMEFLERRSRGFVLLVGLLLLALVALVDGVTGRFDVTIFYFVPVALVTFSRGRRMGLLFAGVASIAWEVADVANHVTSVTAPVTYYNALARFYAYAAVALLISPIRAALQQERDAAEKEAEVAEQLRALMELRDVAERATWEAPAGAGRSMDELRAALHAVEEMQGAGGGSGT